MGTWKYFEQDVVLKMHMYMQVLKISIKSL